MKWKLCNFLILSELNALLFAFKTSIARYQENDRIQANNLRFKIFFT